MITFDTNRKQTYDLFPDILDRIQRYLRKAVIWDLRGCHFARREGSWEDGGLSTRWVYQCTAYNVLSDFYERGYLK